MLQVQQPLWHTGVTEQSDWSCAMVQLGCFPTKGDSNPFIMIMIYISMIMYEDSDYGIGMDDHKPHTIFRPWHTWRWWNMGLITNEWEGFTSSKHLGTPNLVPDNTGNRRWWAGAIRRDGKPRTVGATIDFSKPHETFIHHVMIPPFWPTSSIQFHH